MAGEENKEVVTEVNDQPDEGFSEAFTEAANTGDKSAGDKPEVKGNEGEKEEEEVKEEVKEEKEESSPPPEKSEEKGETLESLEQKYKTLQGMYNKLAEEKGREQPKEEGKGDTTAPPDYSLLFKDLDEGLSEELKAELAEYEDEYDHIAKFEGIKREQLAKRIIGIINASFQEFSKQLEPYLKVTKETAQSSHYTALIQAHPDFEEIRDDVKVWIGKQPKYLKEALQKVYRDGDTEDVIAMFQKYKDETGAGKKTTQPKRERNQDRESNLELVKTKEKGIPPANKMAERGTGDEFSQAFSEAANKYR